MTNHYTIPVISSSIYTLMIWDQPIIQLLSFTRDRIGTVDKVKLNTGKLLEFCPSYGTTVMANTIMHAKGTDIKTPQGKALFFN